jgi:hypothetical protein
VNNNKRNAAGFAWRRADRTTAAGEWLLDLAIALAVAVVALFFGMAADARAGQRTEGASRVSVTSNFTGAVSKADGWTLLRGHS